MWGVVCMFVGKLGGEEAVVRLVRVVRGREVGREA
jgi:hypothetical protein